MNQHTKDELNILINGMIIGFVLGWFACVVVVRLLEMS